MLFYQDAPVSAVSCLPACLCVRPSILWPGPPTGTRRNRTTAAEVPNPSVPLVAVEGTNEYPDPENLRSIAECRGGL